MRGWGAGGAQQGDRGGRPVHERFDRGRLHLPAETAQPSRLSRGPGRYGLCQARSCGILRCCTLRNKKHGGMRSSRKGRTAARPDVTAPRASARVPGDRPRSHNDIGSVTGAVSRAHFTYGTQGTPVRYLPVIERRSRVTAWLRGYTHHAARTVAQEWRWQPPCPAAHWVLWRRFSRALLPVGPKLKCHKPRRR